MKINSRYGVLLINLGTPASAQSSAVGEFLREFLMDPYVIDVPFAARWPLVNLIIAPFRAKKSAEAYQKIWTDEGSPLLVNSELFANKLQELLGDDYKVALAMRYGEPSIAQALEQFATCKSILIWPLFPQFAQASTGTALEETQRQLAKIKSRFDVLQIKDFYDDPGFIAAQAEQIQLTLLDKKVDHILFSYHGLPVRQIEKTAHCETICDRKNACPAISEQNQNCYRAQCFATTKAVATCLNLPVSYYSTSFQSRLGKTPWIEPYTDLELPKLFANGVKKLAVVCPSFVADCLETLEEINLRARNQWLALGGEDFYFIPCVNAQELWVQSAADKIIQQFEMYDHA